MHADGPLLHPMGGGRLVAALRHPLVVLAGAGCGALLGLCCPVAPPVRALTGFGAVFLMALGMTALPIICTGIIAGLGALVRGGTAARILPITAGVFLAVALVAALCGAIAALGVEPGGGDVGQLRRTLGELIQQGGAAGEGTRRSSVANIFAALANGEVLPVVAGCILVGLALGPVRHRAADSLVAAMGVLNAAMLRIVDWILLLLPLGLAGVVAGIAASVPPATLMALLRMVGSFYAGGLLLAVLLLVAIRWASRRPWSEVLAALHRPLQVAFLSSSSISAMPLAIRALNERLGVDARLAGLVVPLGLTSGRAGFPLLFALLAVFTAQLYDQALPVPALLAVSAAAALVGTVTSGSPVVASALFAPVAAAAGLPAQLGIAAVVAVAVLLDPLLSLMNLLGPCACAALVGRAGGDRPV